MTQWHSRWSRVRDFLRRVRLDREIDDELRFHVEEEFDAGVRRGLTPDEAHRAAQDSLGGTPLLVSEQIRDARKVTLADDFGRDLRYGVRLLRRNPAFTSVVISTLGVAIGAAVTVFCITDAWLFRPLRFPHADRLVVAFAASPARPSEPAVWMPYRAYLSWKDSAQAFSSISAAFFQRLTWRTSSDATSIIGMRVTPDFFSTLGVAPLRGRLLGPADADGPPALVMSHRFWQRQLGGADAVLGSTVTLSDAPYIAVGIMPPDFDVRLLDQPEGADVWTLLRTGERGYEQGGIGPVAIVGRLVDRVTLDGAKAEVSAIMRQAESAYPRNFNEFVVNLSSLQADNARTVRATLLTVMASTVCLLVAASMNVGVLLLGRGLARSGEVALRNALGASRGRLVRQFLAESVALSVCGGVLGIGVAVVGTRLFLAWNPMGILPANTARIDGRAVAAATLAMGLTTIVAGLVPALRLATAGPAGALRSSERGRAAPPARRAQRVMLLAQMAGSTVLLICAALFAKTFIQLRAEPLGFGSDRVTVANVELPTTAFASNASRNRFSNQLEERLLARPGVRALAAGTSPPLASGPPTTVQLTSVDKLSAPRVSTQDVTTGFFDTLDIPVIAGRAFDRRDDARTMAVAMLNAQAATDLFDDPRRAVGQRVRLDDESWREVVGVVGNVRTTFFNTLKWRTVPIAYRPAAQAFSRLAPTSQSFNLWVHVRSDQPLSAADIRDAALATDPRAAVISLNSVPELVAVATRHPSVRMTLLLWLCGVSLVLSAIGIYGLVTQTVRERRREIAVRIALGASPRTVIAGFVRDALLAGAGGLVLGVALAVIVARTLESLLYGVRAGDAASIAVAAVFLLVVAGVAAWVPAQRAMRMDVMDVLRG